MFRGTAALLVSMLLLGAPAYARGGHGGGHSHGGGHARAHGGKKSSHSSGTTNANKVHVNGYTTKNGKHVKSHDRTGANKTKNDNWSTKGNTNPETGKAGSKPPDRH